MKPTVLLDCDGVLSDFTRAAVALVNEFTGKNYKSSDVTTWEVFDSIPEPEARREVYRILKGPGGCESIPVYPDAVEGVKKLREMAHIICVTSPFKGSPTWAHEREVWLEKHFGADISYVIHTRHKERIHGEVFIDDKPEHVLGWLDYWSNSIDPVLPILWKTDRTINTPRKPGIEQVSGWPEVHALIQKHFY